MSEVGIEKRRQSTLLNRAAPLIDGGAPPAGVLPFGPRTAHQTAHPLENGTGP